MKKQIEQSKPQRTGTKITDRNEKERKEINLAVTEPKRSRSSPEKAPRIQT
jgi:hypothetical protein